MITQLPHPYTGFTNTYAAPEWESPFGGWVTPLACGAPTTIVLPSPLMETERPKWSPASPWSHPVKPLAMAVATTTQEGLLRLFVSFAACVYGSTTIGYSAPASSIRIRN